MQHISQPLLNTDLVYRSSYVQSFLSFDISDGTAIQGSGPLLKPLVPALLDAIYTKLLQFDVTSAAFVPKLSHELDSSSEPPKTPQELSLDHPHIKRQMSFLRTYIMRIVGNSDWGSTSPIWSWMSHVAAMHTGSTDLKSRRNRPKVSVEYMHLALLLGYLEDAILSTVTGMSDVDPSTKLQVLRAWNKLLWIQNDLFARPYCKEVAEIGQPARSLKRNSPFELTKRDASFAAFGGVLATLLVRFLN